MSERLALVRAWTSEMEREVRRAQHATERAKDPLLSFRETRRNLKIAERALKASHRAGVRVREALTASDPKDVPMPKKTRTRGTR